MFRGIRYVLRNVAIEGGEGAGSATAGSGDSIIDALSTQGQTTTSAEPSVLSGLQNESGNSNPNENAISFPEKYTVKKEDGSLDVDGSTKKLLEGYNNLSKKMGETGGVVPDSADGYKIEFDANVLGLPESVTPELLQQDPDFKQFASEAHKAGFTNEQINLVANKYLSVVQSVVDRKYEGDMNACKTALMETWKTQSELEAGIRNAAKAFNHFASEQDKALMDTIGNNPLIVRLLSNIGATMREDSPARNSQPMESRETINALMKSEAYQDPKHPDHEKVNRQISQYYLQAVGNEDIL